MNIRKKKELIKAIILSTVGLVGAIIIYHFTVSFYLALIIFIIPFILSCVFYNSKVKKRLELEKYLQLKTKSLGEDIADDVLQLSFQNKNYTDHLVKLNLEKNKDLKLVTLIRAN